MYTAVEYATVQYSREMVINEVWWCGLPTENYFLLNKTDGDVLYWRDREAEKERWRVREREIKRKNIGRRFDSAAGTCLTSLARQADMGRQIRTDR